MILADTSVWITHLRQNIPALHAPLQNGLILRHPFVIGELACGNLRDRKQFLSLLQSLPSAQVAADDEVLQFVEMNHLMGQGLGWIDAHLLSAAAISHATLWTFDKPLGRAAHHLNLAYKQSI